MKRFSMVVMVVMLIVMFSRVAMAAQQAVSAVPMYYVGEDIDMKGTLAAHGYFPMRDTLIKGCLNTLPAKKNGALVKFYSGQSCKKSSYEAAKYGLYFVNPENDLKYMAGYAIKVTVKGRKRFYAYIIEATKPLVDQDVAEEEAENNLPAQQPQPEERSDEKVVAMVEEEVAPTPVEVIVSPAPTVQSSPEPVPEKATIMSVKTQDDDERDGEKGQPVFRIAQNDSGLRTALLSEAALNIPPDDIEDGLTGCVTSQGHKTLAIQKGKVVIPLDAIEMGDSVISCLSEPFRKSEIRFLQDRALLRSIDEGSGVWGEFDYSIDVVNGLSGKSEREKVNTGGAVKKVVFKNGLITVVIDVKHVGDVERNLCDFTRFGGGSKSYKETLNNAHKTVCEKTQGGAS